MSGYDINLIRELLEKDKTEKVKGIISGMEVRDLAFLIEQLNEKEKIKLYLLIPTKISSDVLLELSKHSRKFILKSLKDKYIVSMIEKTESDDSADILGEFSEKKVRKIFANLTKKKKEAVEQLIKYEKDTAGGIMQSELLELPGTIKVKEAINLIKDKIKGIEGVNYVYITDKNDKLKGVITIQSLITHSPNKRLYQIMNKDVVKVSPELDKEKVAEVFRKEDLFAVPVVDKRNMLLGRVTVDDVLDVMGEEATEDMLRIAGVHPDESVFDPWRKSLKSRLPWLMVNLLTVMIAALVVYLFEGTLQKVIILAAFLPVIAGMGGNAGTQTLTLVVRSIALNQLNLDNYKKVLFKEILLGLINGLVTGVITAVIAYFWIGNFMIGVVITLAMVINLVVAALVGTCIPLLLKFFKIDPAVASCIFITTFTDIIGFFSLLGIASLLIHWLI
ncbi:magnesium transporter [Candidatus Woesearchaeota archaeon]|nr:magnesium transporter [Candidatus Woesearchaeota archaeon]